MFQSAFLIVFAIVASLLVLLCKMVFPKYIQQARLIPLVILILLYSMNFSQGMFRA
jgi:hypothetical protein